MVIRCEGGEVGRWCGSRSSREVKIGTAIDDLVFWLVDGVLGCHKGSPEKRKGKGIEGTHGQRREWSR